MRHGLKLGSAVAALGIICSSTANAAPTGFTSADPLVSLSVFGTASSRAAVCAAGTTAATEAAAAAAAASATTAATTTAATQAGPGCVLPVLDGVPPPMVQQSAVGVGPVGGGISSLLPLIAIAALGGLAILLLENDDEDDDNATSPD